MVGLAQKCHGYKDVSTVGVRTLMTTAAKQPVPDAIEADQSLRQSHPSGVLTASCGYVSDQQQLKRAAVEEEMSAFDATIHPCLIDPASSHMLVLYTCT